MYLRVTSLLRSMEAVEPSRCAVVHISIRLMRSALATIVNLYLLSAPLHPALTQTYAATFEHRGVERGDVGAFTAGPCSHTE